MTQPVAMAPKVPPTRMAAATAMRDVHPCTTEADMARIGVISGAMSMAPMTTAAESASRPNPAIVVESTRRVAKRAT